MGTTRRLPPPSSPSPSSSSTISWSSSLISSLTFSSSTPLSTFLPTRKCSIGRNPHVSLIPIFKKCLPGGDLLRVGLRFVLIIGYFVSCVRSETDSFSIETRVPSTQFYTQRESVRNDSMIFSSDLTQSNHERMSSSAFNDMWTSSSQLTDLESKTLLNSMDGGHQMLTDSSSVYSATVNRVEHSAIENTRDPSPTESTSDHLAIESSLDNPRDLSVTNTITIRGSSSTFEFSDSSNLDSSLSSSSVKSSHQFSQSLSPSHGVISQTGDDQILEATTSVSNIASKSRDGILFYSSSTTMSERGLLSTSAVSKTAGDDLTSVFSSMTSETAIEDQHSRTLTLHTTTPLFESTTNTVEQSGSSTHTLATVEPRQTFTLTSSFLDNSNESSSVNDVMTIITSVPLPRSESESDSSYFSVIDSSSVTKLHVDTENIVFDFSSRRDVDSFTANPRSVDVSDFVNHSPSVKDKELGTTSHFRDTYVSISEYSNFISSNVTDSSSESLISQQKYSDASLLPTADYESKSSLYTDGQKHSTGGHFSSLYSETPISEYVTSKTDVSTLISTAETGASDPSVLPDTQSQSESDNNSSFDSHIPSPGVSSVDEISLSSSTTMITSHEFTGSDSNAMSTSHTTLDEFDDTSVDTSPISMPILTESPHTRQSIQTHNTKTSATSDFQMSIHEVLGSVYTQDVPNTPAPEEETITISESELSHELTPPIMSTMAYLSDILLSESVIAESSFQPDGTEQLPTTTAMLTPIPPTPQSGHVTSSNAMIGSLLDESFDSLYNDVTPMTSTGIVNSVSQPISQSDIDNLLLPTSIMEENNSFDDTASFLTSMMPSVDRETSSDEQTGIRTSSSFQGLFTERLDSKSASLLSEAKYKTIILSSLLYSPLSDQVISSTDYATTTYANLNTNGEIFPTMTASIKDAISPSISYDALFDSNTIYLSSSNNESKQMSTKADSKNVVIMSTTLSLEQTSLNSPPLHRDYISTSTTDFLDNQSSYNTSTVQTVTEVPSIVTMESSFQTHYVSEPSSILADNETELFTTERTLYTDQMESSSQSVYSISELHTSTYIIYSSFTSMHDSMDTITTPLISPSSLDTNSTFISGLPISGISLVTSYMGQSIQESNDTSSLSTSLQISNNTLHSLGMQSLSYSTALQTYPMKESENLTSVYDYDTAIFASNDFTNSGHIYESLVSYTDLSNSASDISATDFISDSFSMSSFSPDVINSSTLMSDHVPAQSVNSTHSLHMSQVMSMESISASYTELDMSAVTSVQHNDSTVSFNSNQVMSISSIANSTSPEPDVSQVLSDLGNSNSTIDDLQVTSMLPAFDISNSLDMSQVLSVESSVLATDFPSVSQMTRLQESVSDTYDSDLMSQAMSLQGFTNSTPFDDDLSQGTMFTTSVFSAVETLVMTSETDIVMSDSDFSVASLKPSEPSVRTISFTEVLPTNGNLTESMMSTREYDLASTADLFSTNKTLLDNISTPMPTWSTDSLQSLPEFEFNSTTTDSTESSQLYQDINSTLSPSQSFSQSPMLSPDATASYLTMSSRTNDTDEEMSSTIQNTLDQEIVSYTLLDSEDTFNSQTLAMTTIPDMSPSVTIQVSFSASDILNLSTSLSIETNISSVDTSSSIYNLLTDTATLLPTMVYNSTSTDNMDLNATEYSTVDASTLVTTSSSVMDSGVSTFMDMLETLTVTDSPFESSKHAVLYNLTSTARFDSGSSVSALDESTIDMSGAVSSSLLDLNTFITHTFSSSMFYSYTLSTLPYSDDMFQSTSASAPNSTAFEEMTSTHSRAVDQEISSTMIIHDNSFYSQMTNIMSESLESVIQPPSVPAPNSTTFQQLMSSTSTLEISSTIPYNSFYSQTTNLTLSEPMATLSPLHTISLQTSFSSPDYSMNFSTQTSVPVSLFTETSNLTFLDLSSSLMTESFFLSSEIQTTSFPGSYSHTMMSISQDTSDIITPGSSILSTNTSTTSPRLESVSEYLSALSSVSSAMVSVQTESLFDNESKIATLSSSVISSSPLPSRNHEISSVMPDTIESIDSQIETLASSMVSVSTPVDTLSMSLMSPTIKINESSADSQTETMAPTMTPMSTPMDRSPSTPSTYVPSSFEVTSSLPDMSSSDIDDDMTSSKSSIILPSSASSLPSSSPATASPASDSLSSSPKSLSSVTASLSTLLSSSSSPTSSSSSVPSTTPSPPGPTVPTIENSSNETSYWVSVGLLVRSSVDVTSDQFKSNMEQRLANAYALARERQSEIDNGTFEPLGKRRKKRLASAASDPNVKVEVTSVQRKGTTTSVDINHVVQQDGQLVPAKEAVSQMGLLNNQELAIQLNQVVGDSAKPYIDNASSSSDDDNTVLIAGSVSGAIVAIIVIFLVVICCCCGGNRCCVKKSGELRIDDLAETGQIPKTAEQNPKYYVEEESQGKGTMALAFPSKKGKYSLTENEEDADEVTRGRPPMPVKSKKKKKSIGDNSVENHEEDERKQRPKKKGKKRKEEEDSDEAMEMRSVYESQIASLQQSPTTHMPALSTVDLVITGPPTVEMEEDLLENAEEERRKNKQRLREKRIKEKESPVKIPQEDIAHVYERAQKEIDMVLGPRKGSPSVEKPKRKESSKSNHKEKKTKDKDEDPIVDPNEEERPPSDTLEDARLKIHRLLDDAFSLISQSRSSIGSTSSMKRLKRNKVHPTSQQSSMEKESPSPRSQRSHRSHSSLEGADQETYRVIEEKKHTPLLVERSHRAYDRTGLISWSPYRAADDTALISLPNSQTNLNNVAPQREPITSTTVFSESLPSSLQPNYYTTLPGEPIVLNTKDLESNRPSSGGDSNNKSKTTADDNSKTSHTHEEFLTPYYGMTSYHELPPSSVIPISQNSHERNSRNGIMKGSDFFKSDSINSTTDEDNMNLANLKTHNGPSNGRDKESNDFVDVIKHSVQPGASPQPLIHSLREELLNLSRKKGVDTQALNENGNDKTNKEARTFSPGQDVSYRNNRNKHMKTEL